MPRPDLTTAFRKPEVLRGTEFIRLNEQFDVAPHRRQDARTRRAILIKTEVNRHVITYVLVMVIGVGIGVGVAVGLWEGSAILGVATASCVVGAFALIQTFLFGMKFLGYGDRV